MRYSKAARQHWDEGFQECAQRVPTNPEVLCLSMGHRAFRHQWPCDIAVRKTHFRLAGCFLIDDQGLRRRLAGDSQPYQHWACERPARGREACPQTAAERLHTRFPEISFGKRYTHPSNARLRKGRRGLDLMHHADSSRSLHFQNPASAFECRCAPHSDNLPPGRAYPSCRHHSSPSVASQHQTMERT